MSYYYRTTVPNSVFDKHLTDLGYAELKVLLVIIRQTYGWKDKRTGGYKRWDWISQRFFVRKTGLSARAVSTAISQLIYKGLILVKNQKGYLLFDKKQRQQEAKLYFSCTLEPKGSEVNRTKPVKQLHTTIIKHTNMYREATSQKLRRLQFPKTHKDH
ncbi:MAG: replication protein [Xanthomarina gelatinilytica]|uniref:replication protein n=1 Tax=Xanthomarina gelatinilytica TaxID=1137281 RepID=UPI003A84350A